MTREELARIAYKTLVEYYINCVKNCIITVDEYLEMSDCYLFPYYKQFKDGKLQ